MADARAALLAELLGDDGRLFVVSNRGPLTFSLDPQAPRGLSCARGSGGLVTALGELGRYAPVTWVAVAMTQGDRVAGPELRRMDRPLDDLPKRARPTARRVRSLMSEAAPDQDLRLVYVPLDEGVLEPYYEIVSNPFLWFMQHQMYALPYGPVVDGALLRAWRTGYRPANIALADAVIEAARGVRRPVILLQDYHLYLAAPRIRERIPDATILHFTHVPWPPESQWQILPQGLRRAICEGLLACDIVGLQTDRYATHFQETVASFVRDARVDRDGRSVRWRGRRVYIRPYPISLDPAAVMRFAGSDAVSAQVKRIQERVERAGSPRLIVRADRIEPSKNALRGYLAYEEMIERRPHLRSTTRFLAIQAPTRTSIAEYADYAAAVREVVARVNGLTEPDEAPIWIADGTDYAMAIAGLRMANVVLVNPVVDGMNLVAKEAVLVGEHDPVLVLSETAGAAEQLANDCLMVAPADVSGTADQIERALAMPTEERRARLRNLRASVREEDIRWWLDRQLRDIAAIRRGARPASRRLRDEVRNIEAPSE
jgi:trehalose 6-phosphate synthase